MTKIPLWKGEPISKLSRLELECAFIALGAYYENAMKQKDEIIGVDTGFDGGDNTVIIRGERGPDESLTITSIKTLEHGKTHNPTT